MRSFRLYRSTDPDLTNQAIPAKSMAALRSGTAWTIGLFALTLLILDDGTMMRMHLASIVGFWIGVVIILIRRSQAPTVSDLFFIRWGPPLLFILGVPLGSLIWNLIGLSDKSGWQRLLDWCRLHHKL